MQRPQGFEIQQAASGLQALGDERAVHAPRDHLHERPEPNPLPIDVELVRDPCEPVLDVAPVVAQLEGAHERHGAERALTDERLGVDGEPRLAVAAQDVAGMQVLVQQHLVALRVREQGRDRVEGGIDKSPIERATGALPVQGDLARPPPGLLGERPKRIACRDREAPHEVDQHVERVVRIGGVERHPGPTALE